MKWRKLGLVFDVASHPLPAPCVAFAQAPQALVLDDRVRMYFSSRSIDAVGKALSHVIWADFDRDFRVLRTAEAPVVGPGALGCYDEHGVFPLNVVRDGRRVLGFIGGWSRRVSVHVDGAIGLSVSEDDGLTFQRLGDGPVLAASPRQPFLIGDPFVLKIGPQFHMWHIFGTRWQRYGAAGEPERVYKIGHAVSADALTWESTGEGAPLIADVLGEDECQALPTVAALCRAKPRISAMTTTMPVAAEKKFCTASASIVICQDSCHVIQAASFTTLFSCRAGLSQTVAGRSQLRVEPRQRSGLAALASS